MKIIGLVSVSLVWGVLNLAVYAEPMKIQLAQSPTVPQLPLKVAPPAPPTPSPSEPVPIPPPQRPTFFLTPLNKYLFGSLGGRVNVPGTTEALAVADRAFESVWKQAFALKEDSPEFSAQVVNLLKSIAPIQQQYQASGERWGELKMLEVSLKLHYLSCQDRQTLSIAQEGVAMAAATGDLNVKKEWSNLLTQIYWAMGETELAIETQQQMLDTFRTPNGKLTFFEAYDLINLGRLYARVGRQEEAIASYIEAYNSASRPPAERMFLDVYFAAGHTFKQDAIEKLISMYEASRNAQQVEYWIQQREQANQVHEQLSRASNLMWGRLIANLDEQIPPAERKREVEEALQIFRQFGDPWGESDALTILSEVNLALQNYDEAIATGEAALKMIGSLKDLRSWETLERTLVQAYRAVGQDNRAQSIQREYEQFSARQNSARRSRPRFSYGFVTGADYGALPVLHEERRCFGKR